MENTDLKFQEVYNAFQPKILRYMMHMVGEGEAEDLTQEVFVKVNRALGDFRGESSLSTWLYRIATNTAFDQLRSPSRRRTVPLDPPDDSIKNDEPELIEIDVWTGEKKPLVEQQIFHQEMNACLLDHIEKLPENYRIVLMLSEYEGLGNHEIAEILGVSLDTVKVRLHRARGMLKEDLAATCDPCWVEDNPFIPELKMA
jgi:RNA polymerase sigma-70 factor (ECF subfamily)